MVANNTLNYIRKNSRHVAKRTNDLMRLVILATITTLRQMSRRYLLLETYKLESKTQTKPNYHQLAIADYACWHHTQFSQRTNEYAGGNCFC